MFYSPLNLTYLKLTQNLLKTYLLLNSMLSHRLHQVRTFLYYNICFYI
ncbi:hypothetical protein CBC_A0824 [Clostridium botulinum C str. Eklund]|nr:hypothetical protein CBC_A0824 [Clostridium botulinum C str. Eklund]